MAHSAGPNKSLAFGVNCRVHFVLHKPIPTDDDDWEAYFADLDKHLPNLDALFVYAPPGNDLSGKQRNRASKYWDSKPKRLPVAVLSDSTLLRIMANALASMGNNPIRLFSPRDIEQAHDFLKLTPQQRQVTRQTFAELARLLGTQAPW